MIDDFFITQMTLREFDLFLPTPALLSKRLHQHLSREHPDKTIPFECTITDVSYMFDEGGIICHLRFDGLEQDFTAFSSLTHLQFRHDMPMQFMAEMYKKKRIKALRRNGTRSRGINDIGAEIEEEMDMAG